MKNFTPITVISLLLTLISSGQARAAMFTEQGDAGETINTSQAISLGSQPLDSISGMLSGDADLFKIFLTGGQTFSATTINLKTLVDIPVDDNLGSISGLEPSAISTTDLPTAGLLRDPQLFLFDSIGKGVYANDDISTSSQSLLPSGGFSPKDSGIYYLGISGSGYNPVSAGGGRIFPDGPADGVLIPTVSASNLSLSNFTGTSSSGSYTISLTGAKGVPETGVKSVPEPSAALSLLALGALSAVSLRRNKRMANR